MACSSSLKNQTQDICLLCQSCLHSVHALPNPHQIHVACHCDSQRMTGERQFSSDLRTWSVKFPERPELSHFPKRKQDSIKPLSAVWRSRVVLEPWSLHSVAQETIETLAWSLGSYMGQNLLWARVSISLEIFHEHSIWDGRRASWTSSRTLSER